MISISATAYQLLSIAWITTHRQVIHDRTCGRTQWDLSYDFIIVGGGTAGAVVANKLSANRSVKRVLLLEAGGPQNALYNDIPGLASDGNAMNVNEWIDYNEPHDNYGQQYAGGRVPDKKGKTLGGSSAHNGMQYNRGNRRGYDEWVNTYGTIGWSYADVLPVFREWENNTDPVIVANNPGYHGTGGPIQISSQPYNPLIDSMKAGLIDLGFIDTDINGPNQSGLMLSQSYIAKSGFRVGTGGVFIDPNPYPNNLHILCKALVTKILFNGLTAIGVEFIVNDISYTVYANKEIIVSAGPINSPQLLMLSGLGHKRHLQTFKIPVIMDLPVGDQYQIQPTVTISVQIKSQYLSISPNAQLNLEELGMLYYNHTGYLTTMYGIALYHSTSTNRDKQWPNVMTVILPINSTLIISPILVRFLSRGTIRLQSDSPHDRPIIDPNWLSDHGDSRALLEATAFAFYLAEKSSLKQFIEMSDLFTPIGCPTCPGKYAYQCLEGLECYMRVNSIMGHAGGSCRMGAIERPDVVVDPQLRVKGIERLRVCDSSVFPIVPNSATVSASILVGYKCTQFIENSFNLDRNIV